MSNRGVAAGTREIPQLRDFECTFMVWHEGAFAPTHPGHAVLLLRRNLYQGPWSLEENEFDGSVTVDPPFEDADSRYVSFWPGIYKDKSWARGLIGRTSGNLLPHPLYDYYKEMGEGARARLGQIGQQGAQVTPRAGQIVIGVKLLETGAREDIWGQQPEACVALGALCPSRQAELGLNMNEIVRWTQAFAASTACTYAMVDTKRNCAAIAVRAMAAGGGDAFAAVGGCPSKGFMYITPSEAKSYAIAVAAGISHVNRWLARINGFSVGAPPVMDGTDLFTARAFKERSSVAWKIRGAMLRAIDAALERYESLPWDGNYTEKLAALVTIIKNTHDHIQASRSGLRDAAFKELSSRIMAVVRDRAAKAARPWPSSSYYGDHPLVGSKL